MACLGLQYTTTLLLLASVVLLWLPVQVICDDEEGSLLSAINSYRQAQGAPRLEKNDKAACLADEIADELEDRRCPPTSIFPDVAPGSPPGIDDYRDLVKKCGIGMNTTQEGVILPVCVRKRDAALVLSNYTQSAYAGYVNSSNYTGVGIGKDDDWTVVVLASDTPGGSFSGATWLSHGFSYHALFMFMVLPLLVFVLR